MTDNLEKLTPILISSDNVALMLFISKRTLWRMIKSGKLPQPIRFSRKIVRWRKTDIIKFIEELN